MQPAVHPSSAPPGDGALRQRTLSRALRIVMAAGAFLALVNLSFAHSRMASTALVLLVVLCECARRLNRRGDQFNASCLFVSATLGVLTFVLLVGEGLRDDGMLALPVVIFAGTMLFGRRSAPLLLGGTLASAAVVALLGHPTSGLSVEQTAMRLTTVVAILTTATLLVWVVVSDAERHLERLHHADEELRRTYDLTLEGWARILEIRDEETEGHSRRVAELAVSLARDLGLDDVAVANVRRGALLHDIGKLCVPDHVLLKPGPLNAEERRIIERHPVIARDVLGDIPFLAPALSIPYSHHERWDGRGYPLGLAGEDIPLSARLFTVVDQWEALTSDRPYRKAWTRSAALGYLRSNAGTIFEPRLVHAFIRLLEDERRAA